MRDPVCPSSDLSDQPRDERGGCCRQGPRPRAAGWAAGWGDTVSFCVLGLGAASGNSTFRSPSQEVSKNEFSWGH